MNSSTSSSEGRRFGAYLARLAGAGAIVLAGLWLAAAWLLETRVRPQDVFARHMALLRTADAASLALGDSHVARGFSAGDAMLNLAYFSERVPQTALKVRHYFAARRPGRIVLQADPHMFARYRLIAPDRDYAAALSGRPYGRFDLAIASPHHRIRATSYAAQWLAGAGELRSTVRLAPDGALLSDERLDRRNARRVALEAARRARLHRPMPGFRTRSHAPALEALLDDLIRRGATVCLVTFPVSPPYRAAAARYREFAAARAYVRDLAVRRNLRHVDAWAAIDDLALYRDVDHLNRAGARRHSARILNACFGVGAGD